MKFIANLQKNRAIKSYLKVLPPLLKQRYGRLDTYTEGQIRRTIEAAGLNPNHMSYAFAIFMSEAACAEMVKSNHLDLDYMKNRQSIADDYFMGDKDFTFGDAYRFAAQSKSLSEGYGLSDGDDNADWGADSADGGD